MGVGTPARLGQGGTPARSGWGRYSHPLSRDGVPPCPEMGYPPPRVRTADGVLDTRRPGIPLAFTQEGICTGIMMGCLP